jgi:hypothetical protein
MSENFRGEKSEPAGKKMKIYRIVCSCCLKELGTKEAPDNGLGLDISHGICDKCKEKVLKGPEESEDNKENPS